MDGKHWTDDELIARLCDLAPADSHVEECQECSLRWREVCERHELVLRSLPEVSDAAISAQRRSIQTRIQRGGRPYAGLVPIAATVVLLLVAALWFRPVPPSAPLEVASDERLFEDVYSLVATPEPQAIEPVRQIFEVK